MAWGGDLWTGVSMAGGSRGLRVYPWPGGSCGLKGGINGQLLT